MNYDNITLVLGVDAMHLQELRLVWPTWMKFKPEIKLMPCIVFYDANQVESSDLDFVQMPNLRCIPWHMASATSQRELMLSGFLHIPAAEVKTEWYMKIDTDVVATGYGQWIKDEWFAPDERGRDPVFISAKWGYTKPRYLMDLLDDWADRVNIFKGTKRLNLPYSSESPRLWHRRISSWLFFGQTTWIKQIHELISPDGRMPYPSQDSFVFYCARRLGCHYVRVQMKSYNWDHKRYHRLKSMIHESP